MGHEGARYGHEKEWRERFARATKSIVMGRRNERNNDRHVTKFASVCALIT